MVSKNSVMKPDRACLLAVARVDCADLSSERRDEVEQLLARAKPSYGLDPAGSDPPVYGGVMARVVANAFVAADRYGEAWQVMARAMPDDTLNPIEGGELGLLEILLDILHRGVAAARDRVVDDVEPLIRSGHRYARCALLDRMHRMLLLTGRVDESLCLLGDGRTDVLERLTGVANLLSYARPNVLTLVGGERVVGGAERIKPYAYAITGLWRELSAGQRQSPLTARDAVVWALATTGGDVSEALMSLGPNDGFEVEQLCLSLRWFGHTRAIAHIAELVQDFDFAKSRPRAISSRASAVSMRRWTCSLRRTIGRSPTGCCGRSAMCRQRACPAWWRQSTG